MHGMDRNTGKRLDGKAHLLQSIQVILTTPKGSRVMLPEFGCDLYKYIASPMNAETNSQISTEVIDALAQFEPRLTVSEVQVVDIDPAGTITLRIIGEYQSLFFQEDIQVRFGG